MKNTIKAILFFFTVSVLVTTAVATGTPNPSSVKMMLNVTSRNFGNITVGQTATFAVIVTNPQTSGVPLNISWPTVSPPFSITPSGATTIPINPGQSQTFTITFAPTELGTVTKTWSIVNNSINLANPFLFTLSGAGVGVGMSVTPPSWNFGNVAIGQTATRTIDVKNLPNSVGPLNISWANVNPPFSILPSSSSTGPISPGQNKSFTVKFSPTSTGSFNQTWSIVNNSNNQSHPYSIPLSGVGITPPTITMSVSPSIWDFGEVGGGGTRTKEIVISNSPNSPANLIVSPSGLSLTFPFTWIQNNTGQISIPPGGSRSFTIKMSLPLFTAANNYYQQNWTITHNASNLSSPFQVVIKGHSQIQ